MSFLSMIQRVQNNQPGNSYDAHQSGNPYQPLDNTFYLPQRNTNSGRYASETMADIYRAEWQDYMSRFAPLEDELMRLIDDEEYQDSLVNDAGKNSVLGMQRARGIGARQKERMGLTAASGTSAQESILVDAFPEQSDPIKQSIKDMTPAVEPPMSYAYTDYRDQSVFDGEPHQDFILGRLRAERKPLMTKPSPPTSMRSEYGKMKLNTNDMSRDDALALTAGIAKTKNDTRQYIDDRKMQAIATGIPSGTGNRLNSGGGS